MKKWNVPFITRRTDIWTVEAKNATEATMQAVLARQRYLEAEAAYPNADLDAHPDKPTHTHEDSSIGSTSGVAEDEVRPAVVEPDA